MMKNGFEKLKATFRKETLVKMVTGAFACALFALAVLFLLLRLQGLLPAPLLCIIVGGGALCLAAAVLWLILRQNDKRVAKRLDVECQLDERVQTMTEYQRSDDDIAALQRRTTHQTLDGLDVKFAFKRVAWFFVALALSLVLCLTAVFVPLQKDDDGQPTTVVTEKPFALTEYHTLAVRNLIAEVEESKAETNEKTQIVGVLDDLLVDLAEITLRKDMVALVSQTMLAVDGVADKQNSCDDLYKLLTASEYAVVDDFAVWIATTDAQAMTENETAFLQNFQNDDEDALQAQETLDRFVGAATAALALAATTMENDSLFLASYAVVERYTAIAQQQQNDYTALTAALKTAVSQSKGGLQVALSQQFENRATSDTVIDRLQTIFELTDLEVPDFANDWLKPSVDVEQGSDQKDEGLSGGGLPEGDTQYASNDEIFDPDSGKHVPYGDLITEYQKYFNGIAASLPEDLRAFFNEYFQALRNGTEQE